MPHALTFRVFQAQECLEVLWACWAGMRNMLHYFRVCCGTMVACFACPTACRTYFTEHGLLPHLLPILESLSCHSAHCSLSAEPASSLGPSTACSPGQHQPLSDTTTPASPSLGAAGSSHAASPLLPPAPATSPPAGSLSPATMRRATTLRPHTPRDAVEVQRAANLRQCTLAVAALLQDDSQKDLVLAAAGPSSSGGGEGRADCRSGADGGPDGAGSGRQDGGAAGSTDGGSSSRDGGRGGGSVWGLELILALTRPSEQALIQGAAYECLAALTTYDPMRQQVKVGSCMGAEGCGSSPVPCFCLYVRHGSSQESRVHGLASSLLTRCLDGEWPIL